MLGVGNRSDFTKMISESPPPWQYQAKSSLKKISFSFGAGREICDKQVVESHMKPDPANPGPGSYHYRQKSVGEDGPSWTLRSRTSSVSEFRGIRDTPGPGNYAPKGAMNKTGQYFVST